jgi:hypothetical protein
MSATRQHDRFLSAELAANEGQKAVEIGVHRTRLVS